jgi:hypothetical protein
MWPRSGLRVTQCRGMSCTQITASVSCSRWKRPQGPSLPQRQCHGSHEKSLRSHRPSRVCSDQIHLSPFSHSSPCFPVLSHRRSVLGCSAVLSMLAQDRSSLSSRAPTPLLLETDDICSPHKLLPYSTANRSPCSDDDIVPSTDHTPSASLSILLISFICVRHCYSSLFAP